MWVPTRYGRHRGALRASRDRQYVRSSSRLHVDAIAGEYQTVITEYVRGDLLDLGCGTAPLYAEYLPFTSSVTCADRKAPEQSPDHRDFAVDLGEPLPFDDLSYDTVLLSDVLEHVPDPALALGEIHRCLRPSGHLIGNTPFMYPLHEEPYDFRRFTRHGIQHVLQASGLEPVEIREVGGPIEVIGDTTAKMLAGVPITGGFLAQLCCATFRFLAKLAGLSDAFVRGAKPFPISYVFVAVKRA